MLPSLLKTTGVTGVQMVMFVLIMSVLHTEAKAKGPAGPEEYCSDDKDCVPNLKCCQDPGAKDGQKTKICMKMCAPSNVNVRQITGRQNTIIDGQNNITVFIHHMNWLDAAQYCAKLFGTLLPINSMSELERVSKLASEILLKPPGVSGPIYNSVWIDGSDVDKEGKYTQVFQRTPFEYPRSFFSKSEAKGDDTQNCMAVIWYLPDKNNLCDLYCHAHKPFACLYPSVKPKPTPKPKGK